MWMLPNWKVSKLSKDQSVPSPKLSKKFQKIVRKIVQQFKFPQKINPKTAQKIQEVHECFKQWFGQ